MLAAVLEDFLFNEVYVYTLHCARVHNKDRAYFPALLIVYYVHVLISHFFLVFLNAHRPDGVQLTAEQLREHEAIDIKVPHILLILCSRYFNNTHSCVLVIECLFVVPIYLFSCMQVIELIKRDILPVSKQTPDEFLNRLTSILNRGSIHSATDNIDGMHHLSLSLSLPLSLSLISLSLFLPPSLSLSLSPLY